MQIKVDGDPWFTKVNPQPEKLTWANVLAGTLNVNAFLDMKIKILELRNIYY